MTHLFDTTLGSNWSIRIGRYTLALIKPDIDPVLGKTVATIDIMDLGVGVQYLPDVTQTALMLANVEAESYREKFSSITPHIQDDDIQRFYERVNIHKQNGEPFPFQLAYQNMIYDVNERNGLLPLPHDRENDKDVA